MKLLDYRLTAGELFDAAQRRALFDEMAEAYPDLRRFLVQVDTLLTDGDAEQRAEISEMEDELRDVYSDLEAERAANEELRSDLDYWKGKAGE